MVLLDLTDRVKLFLAVLFLMFLTRSPAVYGQQPYTVSSTEFVVFRDGVVRIEQTIYVDETVPSISLTLFSRFAESILAVDQANLPLSFEMIYPPNLTLITLGSSKVTLNYLASDLTRKKANVWTLSVNSSYPITMTLPDNSNIVYLSGLPSSITSQENKPVLVISPGTWEISYTTPIVPSPSPTPTPTPTTPTPTPTIPVPPPTTTQPTPPTTTPLPTTTPTPPTPQPTPTPTKSTSPTETTTLPETPQPPSTTPLNLTVVLITAIISTIAVVMLYLLKIRRVEPEDFELRPEDRELLEYLAARGGRALESELRQRFSLPKSSMWRMARRLETLGYIKIRKVGIQNQIELVRRIG